MLLVGPPVEALRERLLRSDINNGPIFRAIDRWGGLEERALTPQSITPGRAFRRLQKLWSLEIDSRAEFEISV